MQEIMQYTTYGIALIGGLAFLVAIIVQVLKELPKLKKIPTSVVALVVSLILCPVTLIALCTWYAVKITWYYVMAARCFSGVSRCDRRMGKNKRNLGSNTIQKERSMKQTDITLLTI